MTTHPCIYECGRNATHKCECCGWICDTCDMGDGTIPPGTICEYCEVTPATVFIDGDGCERGNHLCSACDREDFSDLRAEYEADPDIMDDMRRAAAMDDEAERFNYLDAGYMTRAALHVALQIVEDLRAGRIPSV